MKIRIEFGVPATRIREVAWYEDIDRMHKVMQFDGKFWEWIAYEKDLDGHVDYVLMFGEIQEPAFNGLPIPTFDDIFSWQREQSNKCQCGAAYQRGFENVHSSWCPKWVKI